VGEVINGKPFSELFSFETAFLFANFEKGGTENEKDADQSWKVESRILDSCFRSLRYDDLCNACYGSG
jgi:hypothetical protein